MIRFSFSRSLAICFTCTLLFIFSTLTGCKDMSPSINLAPNHPKLLKLKLTQFLELAQSSEKQVELQNELGKSLLTAPQVASLLREHPQRQAWSQFYEEKLAKQARTELLWTLQEAVKLGYSQLEVSRIGPHAGSTNAHGDLALLEMLKSRDGLFTIRLKRNESDKQALRISGWLYQQDLGWVTLLKLGEEILQYSK